jgi:hypothetical protein
VHSTGLLVIAVIAAGCVREPATSECPDLATGDLVITEIRGPQNDPLGAWIELYNASGASIDLQGTKVRFRKRDGSAETDILVRRSVEVAAGAYVVLGLFDDSDGMRPAYVDYGFAVDFHATWLSAAAVDVEACGQLVDRAIYDSLPDMGTFSLGTQPPDATSNDLPASWCTDATAVGTTFPGTPQHMNIACP